nr:outer membrane protein assembly factor BamE [Brenneria sp. hezel4-2-4]
MKKIIISVFVFLSLVSCSSVGNQSLKNETQESVKTKIIKGKTTKQDVLASFGEPDSRSLIDGEEQWSYTMYNSQSKATSFIPVVGLLAGGANTQTKSLTVMFKGEKVSSYIFNAGKSDVKTGIF